MRRIIHVKPSAGPSLEQIRAAAPDCQVQAVDRLSPLGSAESASSPEACSAVLGASPRDDLHRIPGLDWVHSGAAGVDGWLTGGVLPQGVTLTSAAGNGAIPLAEHALMLMLMLSRDAPRWMKAQREHRWDRFTHGELTGQTLGIIGYGNSGQDLASKAQACHMKVQALRRSPSGDRDGQVRLLHGEAGLTELLDTSDFVVVTAPMTSQTGGMLGRPQLRRMKPGAFLIVISRGGIVDEEALLEVLEEGHLGGAGLDAHGVEPLPEGSPLWDMPRVIVTPHNGATTDATLERGHAILLDNVSRWAAGRSLRNVVDRSRGY
ncbi:D-2-hydroxyacid dehydrogenase [Nesterenkonia xinjiangensis]